jgi:hypothetical protein
MSDKRDVDRRKVPTWDGSPEAFETYEVKVGIFMKTQPRWKEPELVAELVSKLEGKAWQLIEQISEEEREIKSAPKNFSSFSSRRTS